MLTFARFGLFMVLPILLVVACSQQAEVSPTAVPSSPIASNPTSEAVSPTPESTEIPEPTTPTPVPNPTADPITGAPALARGEVLRRPYVVMLDNHPDAYPQSGMDKAAMVIEALAEFGITRYVAIYAPGITPDVDQIGPVRSTRLYFAQWAMGFHGIYAHAGGSEEGLAAVETTDQLINLDGLLANGVDYFVRSNTRFAPHNLFTSTDELTRAAKDFGVTDFDDPEIGYLFKEDIPEDERPESGSFSYYFIYAEDPAGWTYDPETNGYLRLRRGVPAIDAVTGEQLWTKNVVVMEVIEAPIPGDPQSRISQQVIGEGPARLFMDGEEQEGVWRMEEAGSPLRFYTTDDEEIRFNAGPIWAVAIPSMDNLTVE